MRPGYFALAELCEKEERSGKVVLRSPPLSCYEFGRLSRGLTSNLSGELPRPPGRTENITAGPFFRPTTACSSANHRFHSLNCRSPCRLSLSRHGVKFADSAGENCICFPSRISTIDDPIKFWYIILAFTRSEVTIISNIGVNLQLQSSA